MPTIKEIRKELIELRTFLVSQKAGLSRIADAARKTNINEAWRKYAIENSDKTRKRINKVIEMLDALRG